MDKCPPLPCAPTGPWRAPWPTLAGCLAHQPRRFCRLSLRGASVSCWATHALGIPAGWRQPWWATPNRMHPSSPGQAAGSVVGSLCLHPLRRAGVVLCTVAHLLVCNIRVAVATAEECGPAWTQRTPARRHRVHGLPLLDGGLPQAVPPGPRVIPQRGGPGSGEVPPPHPVGNTMVQPQHSACTSCQAMLGTPALGGLATASTSLGSAGKVVCRTGAAGLKPAGFCAAVGSVVWLTCVGCTQ